MVGSASVDSGSWSLVAKACKFTASFCDIILELILMQLGLDYRNLKRLLEALATDKAHLLAVTITPPGPTDIAMTIGRIGSEKESMHTPNSRGKLASSLRSTLFSLPIQMALWSF